MNKDKKNALKGFIGFILYFVFSYGSSIPLLLLGIDYTILPIKIRALYMIFYSIFTIFIYYMLFREELNSKFMEFIKDRKLFLKKYLNYWFLILGIMIISNLLIFTYTNDMASNENSIRETFKLAPIYTYFASVIYAPFIEEMVFRNCLYKIFRNKYLFIFISGFIFGSLHVFNDNMVISDLLYLIPYCTPGFIFAYILTKSDNIFNTIGLHFIHNGILMTLQVVLMLQGLM